jgi:predicted dienelactone hydrolase
VLVLAAVLTGGADAKPPPDPTAPGPHAVGYARLTITRTATLTAAERRLESVVWYPAEVAGETPDANGHRDAAVARGRHPLLVYSHAGRSGGLRGVLTLAPDARPERIGDAPLRVPTMVMVGALDFYDPQQTSLDAVWALLPPPRYAVHLARTGHFAFSDPCIPLDGGRDCEPGTLSQDDAHRLVLRYAVPFLLRHVDGARRWSALLRPDTVVGEASLRAEPRR